jgi:putative ABC transport system substrate-binding protein
MRRRYPSPRTDKGVYVSYALPAAWRRAVGAKPADLPVEQPTKFERIFNLKTATALSLTIPPSLLLRVDEVTRGVTVDPSSPLWSPHFQPTGNGVIPMISRRRYITGLAAALVAGPHAAKGQSVTKIPRLCFLAPSSRQAQGLYWYEQFFQRLRDLGYVEGRTITIDYLSAENRAERFPALAAECLSLKADIIVAGTTPAALAAKNETRTIPIVLLGTGEPVVTGIVDSLARPWSNITGLSHLAPGLMAKRLELLKQVVPRLSTVLVLAYFTDPIAAPQVKELQNAARSLGVRLVVRDIKTVDDLPAAFDAGARERAEGLLMTVESIFGVFRARVIELAAKHRWPAISPLSAFVEDGGLMCYGVNFANFFSGAAVFVDKILKGAKPGDLPIEQPTNFELVINLKTAKTLGLTIPPSVLVRADRVIE